MLSYLTEYQRHYLKYGIQLTDSQKAEIAEWDDACYEANLPLYAAFPRGHFRRPTPVPADTAGGGGIVDHESSLTAGAGEKQT